MKEPERHSVEGMIRVWNSQAERALPHHRYLVGRAYLGLLGVSEGVVFSFFLGKNEYAQKVVAERLQQAEWNPLLLRQFWDAARSVFPHEFTDADVTFLSEHGNPDAVDAYLRRLAAPAGDDLISAILRAAEPAIDPT